MKTEHSKLQHSTIRKSLYLIKYCLILLGFVLNSNLIHSQVVENKKTYTTEMDNLFSNLKKNDIKEFKNGILYDRVYSIARLESFNKTNSSNGKNIPNVSNVSNTSNYQHFTRAWEELNTASINPDFMDWDKLTKIAYSFERQNKIQIAIINADFTTIDTTALGPNNPKLKIVNKKMQRIAGKNPYIQNTVFVASPLNSKTITENSATFEFGKIFLNLSSKKIFQLTAAFEDNQNFTIFENGVIVKKLITVPFKTSGVKNIVFSVVFSDKTTLTTYANFRVTIPETAITSRLANSISAMQYITATKPFQGYDETTPSLGQGEYKIYYAPNHTQITKPYIVVDGFDPHDTRKIDDTDDNPDNDLYSMMNYNIRDNLVDDLNAEGYDVIILNFPEYVISSEEYCYYEQQDDPEPVCYWWQLYRDGGADYVERNAKVVEALISEVNTTLATASSTANIKIAGPSMGALIVQYALAEMEHNNENHNVNLFVSFDGPHKGANIAIGIQKTAEYFNIEDFLYPLKTPSAKQMLINHYLSGSEGLPAGAPGFRDRFQNELNTIGFPTQCRNIAMINGSIMGEQKASPATNMAHVDGSAYLLGARRIGYIDYSPDSGQRQVFRYLNLNAWGIFSHTSIRNGSTSSSFGSLDNAPGGFLSVKGRLEKSFGVKFPFNCSFIGCNLESLHDSSGADFFSWWEKVGLYSLISFAKVKVYVNIVDESSFVPTKSALAFSGTNTLYKEQIGCRNLVCTGETPFSSYYAPTSNQEHASLHNDGVIWLMGELTGQFQSPTVYAGCTSGPVATITGDNSLCYNANGMYYLNNQCNSTTSTTWSTSSNLQMTYSNNEQVSVKSIDPDMTFGWIRATLSNGQTATKNICGKPDITTQITPDTYQPTINVIGQNFSLSSQGIYDGATWTQTGGNGSLISNGLYSAYATGSGTDWYVSGNVMLTNSCGSSVVYFDVAPQAVSDPCSTLSLNKVSANTYRIIAPCDPAIQQSIMKTQIFNVYGTKIKEILPAQDIIDLTNISSPGTILIIKAESNGKTITEKVITD